MPTHKLTSTWTKIASAGESVTAINSGQGVADLGGPAGARPFTLTPSGVYSGMDLTRDLYARSDEAGAEVVTNITPGMPRGF